MARKEIVGVRIKLATPERIREISSGEVKKEGSKTDASPAPGSGRMPQAEGPVGTGADGVDITIDSVAVHVWMEKVTRVGDYLVGELLMRTDSELIMPAMAFSLPGTWGGLGGQWMVWASPSCPI